jgi:hypothetical protein
MTNVANRLQSLTKGGRCDVAAKRLGTTLKGLARKSKPMRVAHVLSFIGNEVGDLKTLISETKDVDRFLIRDDASFDAKLLRCLGDINVRNLPSYTVKLLQQAGWKPDEELKGARFGFYPDAGDPDPVNRTVNYITLIQWKSILVMCDRNASCIAHITGVNSFNIAAQVKTMGSTLSPIGNGGKGSTLENPAWTLARIRGYLHAYSTCCLPCVHGEVPAPNVIPNRGYRIGAVGCGTRLSGDWRRPHVRTTHYRYLKSGKCVLVKGCMIHAEPVLIKDMVRANGIRCDEVTAM